MLQPSVRNYGPVEQLKSMFDKYLSPQATQDIIDSATREPFITIAGPIGSGKTALASGLADRLGFRVYSAGSAFRQLAADKGITVEELSARLLKSEEESMRMSALTSYEVARIMASSKEGIIAEGQLTGLYGMLLSQLPKKSMSILLKCERQVRVDRIIRRNGAGDVNAILAREASDTERWMREFGVDPDKLYYDFVIDTNTMHKNEMVDAAARKWYEL